MTPASRGASAGVAALALVLLLAVVAPLRTAGQPPDGASPVVVREIGVRGPDGTEQHALLTYPRDRGFGALPVVVALHGRGEAVAGPDQGYRGWNEQYGLGAAYAAMLRGTVTEEDLGGMVRPRHLSAIQTELRRRPFRGLVVVTPYTPDLLRGNPTEELARYGAWLAGPLLDRVTRVLPFAAHTRESTGVDGVSLGGFVALHAGLSHPDRFGAVGGIQPAITGHVDELVALARAARDRRLLPELRLLSSDGDPFLGVTQELSRRLLREQVPHRLVVVPGPHGYAFNRGPGSVELLRFGYQALAGAGVERAAQPF